MVYLKALTYKGTDRTAMYAKLSSRYMGLYRIVERVGVVAYKMDLPSEMRVFHNVFHVSQLRKHITERETVIEEAHADLQKDLAVVARPVRVIDRKEKTERGKLVRMVQVIWDCNGHEQVTWEKEARMKDEYPKWFDKLQTDESDSRTNPKWVGESCSISIRENSE
ncbi:unnamed protein product [Thlaspi arvense]|uniref:Tf2-1-like SH3-like domain-containing protein n=1 Tax=Thlaspi arvense TaxID=13288 RepID=A0AAU9R7T4_THLAR|nr:unnamed protein product [Thlaspi arvense]